MFVGSVGEACCGKECDSNHQFQRSFNHQIFQKNSPHPPTCRSGRCRLGTTIATPAEATRFIRPDWRWHHEPRVAPAWQGHLVLGLLGRGSLAGRFIWQVADPVPEAKAIEVGPQGV